MDESIFKQFAHPQIGWYVLYRWKRCCVFSAVLTVPLSHYDHVYAHVRTTTRPKLSHDHGAIFTS